ncbi:glycosyltransferase family 2 protein [Acinetobacter pittii]|uniref:glycosyltransferase family 2 protein n=1 Tax=Acinetobacter pittii TaxID=48296 RepID=UPI000F73BFFD|nr:glycosyltransferase family 2 protein [Acinetobacter pittii]RSO85808.1 glycosyltransferase family 2 protein [Acinetobacter pittii]
MDFIPGGISVVIPTYNRAHLIKESLQSVLNQTLQPLEIIVVDDFSTDNTEEVVKSLNSPLIKYFKNQRTKGANGARNTGIMLSRGEFIAFHDSDDTWLPQKLILQKLVFDKQKDINLCFCSLESIDSVKNEKRVIPRRYVDKEKVKDVLWKKNIISTQTIMVRATLAYEIFFDEELKRFQDWDYVLRVVNRGEQIFHLDTVLVRQVINISSISSTNNFLDNYWVLAKKHPYLIRNGVFAKQLYYKSEFSKNKSIQNIAVYVFMTIVAKFYSRIFY